ncbi:MAG: hypothetical protein PF444_07635 [Bacteroidales bacterium]|jgi:hypothetical protein|nr:hypothetical protein [Bacteroidales bacterium]
MEYIIELLKIILPAVLVIWAVFTTMSKFLARMAPTENDKSNKALRLKAYERLTLFLERISPDKLIQRIQDPNMTSAELQIALLKIIRQEYEHNLTQQLYVSNEAWNSVIIAKEGVNQLINSSIAGVEDNSPSLELAKMIIHTYQSTKSTPVELSIRMLKSEVVKLLS